MSLYTYTHICLCIWVTVTEPSFPAGVNKVFLILTLNQSPISFSVAQQWANIHNSSTWQCLTCMEQSLSIIGHTCVYPTISCQNGCCEKYSPLYICLLFDYYSALWGRKTPLMTLLSDLFPVTWVWMGRGGHRCNVYCLCVCFMCFRLWTSYFSWVYFVWHFVLLCGWHMEWWSCVKNWFETLVNIAQCCYWKSGWWFHHLIKEWKSIANYVLKQTTHYI